MIFTQQVRTLYIASVMLLATTAAFFAQVVMQYIAQGLSQSGHVRVAPATACEVSKDGAHFTGCSSIL